MQGIVVYAAYKTLLSDAQESLAWLCVVMNGTDDMSSACRMLPFSVMGWAPTKTGFVLPQMAAALAEKGLSSLRFDFPGNGESDGTFRYANMKEEVRQQTRLTHAFMRKQAGAAFLSVFSTRHTSSISSIAQLLVRAFRCCAEARCSRPYCYIRGGIAHTDSARTERGHPSSSVVSARSRQECDWSGRPL